MHYFRFSFLIIVVVLANHAVICKRSGSSGKRTSARTTPRTTHHQQTPPYVQPNNNYQQNNPNPAIGFDNVNRQSASNHPIGFENVQNRAPLGNQNQPTPNIGFNNAYHPPQQPQVPQQTQFGAQQPPGTWNHPTSGYNPQAQPPPGAWNHPANGYNPPGQFGGYTPHGGGYNPPGSYYNNFATPGIQPQFYQPPQQSSGIGAGTLLGVAGGFGGGYLLGRLTSGGNDHKDAKENAGKTEQQQFVVHHYYHNSQEIPKQITVANNSLVACAQNVTQNLCVPNTFAMCFSNGTIMCVTHTRFTVPCGTNTSMACIITALPCNNNKDKTCNTASNLSTTVVYVPCISNVTVTGQNETSLGNNELCITAIAEPTKKLGSPVPSLINFMSSIIATLPFELQQSMNFSGITSQTIMPMDIKTIMPPSKVSDG